MKHWATSVSHRDVLTIVYTTSYRYWRLAVRPSLPRGDAPTTEHEMRVALRSYEGLVLATARRCAAFSEENVEDIAQLLRVKVWKALCAYDPAKCRTTRDKYVFMCVRDRAKDVVKKKKRDELHIEDVRNTPHKPVADWFDARYLCSSREDNYAGVEDDDVTILDSLDELERAIAALMLTGEFIHAELAEALGVSKAEVERAMKSIRAKLRPDPDPDSAGTVVDLPRARGTRKTPPTRGRGRLSACDTTTVAA